MDVHTAFSVILPEYFPVHVSGEDRHRKKEKKKTSCQKKNCLKREIRKLLKNQ